MPSLRQRITEDMQVRNFALNTQTAYLREASLFARFFNQSPDTLGPEDTAPPILVSIMKLDGITGQGYPAYTTQVSRDSLVGQLLTPPLGGHPAGTIFAIEPCCSMNCAIGIDPLTGAKKFSVSLAGWAYFGMIIAGDGNAYVPYQRRTRTRRPIYRCRVDSNGAFTKIKIQDWTNHCLPIHNNVIDSVKVITSADTGILLTWKMMANNGCAGSGNWYEPGDRYGMAIVTGTSVSVVRAPQIPGQVETLIPVLQAQDGSFVGKIGIGGDFQPPTQYNMVAFDASGNVRWSVPNEDAQIATADGGVIGKSGITYDQSGSATGQAGDLPTYPWYGYAYRIGTVDQWLVNPIMIALDYWAFQGGNHSRNGTAVKQQWFPPLPSCADNGACAGAPKTVKQKFEDASETTAVAVSPCYPFKSFWQPVLKGPVPSDPANPLFTGFGVGVDHSSFGVNIYNESNLFHGVLHGMTGLYDAELATALNVGPSLSISIYLKNNVLSGCPTFRH